MAGGKESIRTRLAGFLPTILFQRRTSSPRRAACRPASRIQPLPPSECRIRCIRQRKTFSTLSSPCTGNHLASFQSGSLCLTLFSRPFSFAAQNNEELSFVKGERLEILDRPPADPDWYRARNTNGSIGLIPKNYVQVWLSIKSSF